MMSRTKVTVGHVSIPEVLSCQQPALHLVEGSWRKVVRIQEHGVSGVLHRDIQRCWDLPGTHGDSRNLCGDRETLGTTVEKPELL